MSTVIVAVLFAAQIYDQTEVATKTTQHMPLKLGVGQVESCWFRWHTGHKVVCHGEDPYRGVVVESTIVCKPSAVLAPKPPYVIQPANNTTDDWARIDFEFRISDGSEAYCSKADADRTGPLWVRKIFNVEGVEALDVRQYELRVRKSTLGKWERILVTVAEIVVEENRKKK